MTPSFQLPVRNIQRIQSCGHVLAFEEDARCTSGMRILCVSDNIVEAPWIDTSSRAELLGKDLGRVFTEESVVTVRALVARQKKAPERRADRIDPRVNANTACIFPLHSKPLTCTLGATTKPRVYLLELEMKDGPNTSTKSDRTTPDVLRTASLLRRIPIGLPPTLSTAALCDALAESMPAYDRVMVCRVHHDGSGEITHESTREGFEADSSFLNRRL